jgi:glycine cleavage system pyridoxal-binding protein P
MRDLVPTENSIALKNRDRHAIGEKFLGFAKALAAVPKFVREMPHRLLGAGAEDHGSPSLWSLCGEDARIAHAARRS